MKKSVYIFAVVFLAGALAIQYFGFSNSRGKMVAADAGALIPKELPGWTVEDKPIAETPDLQKVVESILNFDSAIFRTYKQEDTEISIYIAYWLPGKIPVGAVDAHTPDICWVANGWSMTKMPALPGKTMDDGVLVPIPNYRKFHVASTNSNISVVYWHFDGKTLREQYSRREGGMTFWERTVNRLKHFQNIIFTPPMQQVFVRVSSNKDIGRDDMLNMAPVQSALKLVESLMSGKILYTEEE